MLEPTRLEGPSAPPRGGTGASPRLVLVIVCAGVVLASLDLFIVNVALPQIARDLKAPNLSELSWVLNGYAIVYAVAAGVLRPAGRPLPARPGLSARRGHFHRSLGRLCRFDQRGDAGGLPAGASRGSRTAHADLAGIGAGRQRSPEKRPGAVRAWTAAGGLAAALGTGGGGTAGRGQLAVGVPGQCAGRYRCADRGLAPAARGSRPSHPRDPTPSGVVLATAGVAG